AAGSRSSARASSATLRRRASRSCHDSPGPPVMSLLPAADVRCPRTYRAYADPMSTPPPTVVRLEADGVVLRAYGPDDAPALERAFADPEIARWNPAPAGPDPVGRFVRERNDWSDGDHVSWAVADASDRFVG